MADREIEMTNSAIVWLTLSLTFGTINRPINQVWSVNVFSHVNCVQKVTQNLIAYRVRQEARVTV